MLTAGMTTRGGVEATWTIGFVPAPWTTWTISVGAMAETTTHHTAGLTSPGAGESELSVTMNVRAGPSEAQLPLNVPPCVLARTTNGAAALAVTTTVTTTGAATTPLMIAGEEEVMAVSQAGAAAAVMI